MSDAFTDGRRFRVRAVVDDFSREYLALVADTSLSGLRVTRELDALLAIRGRPATIVSDNVTELTSMAALKWCEQSGIEWHYIAPGKPMQNGLIESFMYGRPLRCKAVMRLGQGASRVRSCMRPMSAAHLMTAGPDGARGSTPHQRDALYRASSSAGFVDPRSARSCHHLTFALATYGSGLRSNCGYRRRAEALPPHHQCPSDARHLFGERNDHDLWWPTFLQSSDPASPLAARALAKRMALPAPT